MFWSGRSGRAKEGAAGSRKGAGARRCVALFYVACLLAVLGTIRWQTAGSASAAMLTKPRLHLRKEVNAVKRQEDDMFFQESGKLKLQGSFVQDVVAHPDELLLLLRVPERSVLPGKEWLSCYFGNGTYTAVTGVDLYGTLRAAVRCLFPPPGVFWSARRIFVEDDKGSVYSSSRVSYAVPLEWQFLVFDFWSTREDIVLFAKGIMRKKRDIADISKIRCVYDGELEVPVTTAAQEVFRCPHPPGEVRHRFVDRLLTLKWDGDLLPSIVYYEPANMDDVSPGRSFGRSLDSVDKKRELVASGGGDDKSIAGSRHSRSMERLSKKAASEQGRGKLVKPGFEMKEHLLCSCNVIWNGAKFLREWVTYNAFLGVDKFFFYDNNSDDETQEVIRDLALSGYNIARIVWPWIKAQEAGFSHCAIMSARECTWMMYIDVDEFAFPAKWLNDSVLETESSLSVGMGGLSPSPKSAYGGIVRSEKGAEMTEKGVVQESGEDEASAEEMSAESLVFQNEASRRDAENWLATASPFRAPLASLILEKSTMLKGRRKVGQISIRCRNFGPSGLSEHPIRGVTIGYTCRVAAVQRHKSLVLLDGINKSLKNYVHHFDLAPGYQTVHVHVSSAVINHYKYQVWDEFKTKFKRRVSTYVADWTEMRRLDSKDRAPGLGNTAVKPVDWDNQFCEVKDFALRNFSLRVFSAGKGETMIWQKRT